MSNTFENYFLFFHTTHLFFFCNHSHYTVLYSNIGLDPIYNCWTAAQDEFLLQPTQHTIITMGGNGVISNLAPCQRGGASSAQDAILSYDPWTTCCVSCWIPLRFQISGENRWTRLKFWLVCAVPQFLPLTRVCK